MTSRHNEPQELLGAMLELPPDERDAFLDDQCGSDTALRAEVDRLRLDREPPSSSPSAQADADGDTGSFVEELLGACSDQLWQIPAGNAPTMAASRVSGVPPSLGDRYEIERELGHGGMGTVYLARDNKLKRRIALKMLPEACTYEPRRRAMFEREACTAANLSHANVATVYEFEEFDGKPYIAMEYVEGRPLRQVLAEEQPLPLSKLLDIALQMTEGLHAAHRQSIIHRDLKPANVMVTDEGQVKILDFGLAKALQTRDWDGDTSGGPVSVGSSGVLLGTPGYMSPEQARREEDVDERTDLFSLGIVLYEMVTGDGPFHRDTPEECISAALNDTPRPVAANSKLPTAVADVINKLLEKGKEDRYQSTEEVLEDLRQLVAAQDARKKGGLLKWLVAAAVLVVLALVAKDTLWPTNPNIDKIILHEDAGEFRAAYDLLKKQEERFGADHPTLGGVRTLLDGELRDSLKGKRDHLSQLLADGHENGVFELLPGIRDLEHLRNKEVVSRNEGGKTTRLKTVDKLIDDASGKHQGIERKKGSIQGCINECRWQDALDASQELENETFEGRPFRPAERVARALMAKLVEGIPAQKYADLLKVREAIDVLEQIKPDHPELPRLRGTENRLSNVQKLIELHKQVSPESSVEALRDRLGKMEGIDREHLLTKEVAAWLQARMKQESHELFIKRFKAGVIGAFSSKSQGDLEMTVDIAREIGDLDSKDLESLDAALKWLHDLNMALGLGVAQREQADDTRGLLDKTRNNLPEYLRKAADGHLNVLAHHISLCRKIAEGDLLYKDITKACRVRQLSKARDKLAKLTKMGLPELAAKRGDAVKRVGQLLAEIEEEKGLDTRFGEFLKRLQAKEFGRAEDSFKALLHGWGKVKTRLGVAIDASDGEWKADLLLRRAKLNLRLGLPLAAAADAETADKYAKQATAKREAQLLWAQAEFAQSGPGKAKGRGFAKIHAALARLKGMGDSEQVLYWRGVCESALALDPVLEEAKRQPRRVRALKYLRDAIKRGYKSTAADVLVAHLMKNAQKRKDAIRWIEESLDKQWTEEGLIAVFGKVPDVKKAKEQLRDTYITQASQHQWLGEWKESLDPAQKAVNVGGDYAWSYLVLAGAKLQIGDLLGCESALDKAVSLLPQLGDEAKRTAGEIRERELRKGLKKRR